MSTTAPARPGRPPQLGKPPLAQQPLRQPIKPPLLQTAQTAPPMAKPPATKQPAKQPVAVKPKGPAQPPPAFKAWQMSNAELQAILDDPGKVSAVNYNLVLYEIDLRTKTQATEHVDTYDWYIDRWVWSVNPGTRKATFRLAFPSGLVIRDMQLIELADGRRFIDFPSLQFKSRDGVPQYKTIIELVDEAAEEDFQAAVMPIVEAFIARLAK